MGEIVLSSRFTEETSASGEEDDLSGLLESLVGEDADASFAASWIVLKVVMGCSKICGW